MKKVIRKQPTVSVVSIETEMENEAQRIQNQVNLFNSKFAKHICKPLELSECNICIEDNRPTVKQASFILNFTNKNIPTTKGEAGKIIREQMEIWDSNK